MSENHWIDEENWRTIVEHVPIVSVDLVVFHDDAVLLGTRENEPAKGEWFVPGGRVLKNERRTDAVRRVAREELGTEVEIVESLGTFEHFYEVADVDVSSGKHYLASGYVVTPTSTDFALDSQHSSFRFFDAPPRDVHEYVAAYVAASKTIDDWTRDPEP